MEIQIVESNPHLRSLLGWHLQQAGYRIFQSADLAQGREMFLVRQPALVVLDTETAGGLEFCTWLQSYSSPLVLMLSNRSTEADIVQGLRAGADDYLTKPLGMQEFLARVDALTRRQRLTMPPSRLQLGDLCIDLVQRRVNWKRTLIDLTPQEFSLLYVLVQAGGRTLSRLELLHRAWPDTIDNPRTVDTHILSLRKKVELEPRRPHLIQTVRNAGYRMNIEFIEAATPAVRRTGT